MELSKHNIFSRIHQSEEYFVVNLLSGNADILTADEASFFIHQKGPFPEEFIRKGFVSDPDQEEQEYRLKYLDFLDTREQDEIQLFYAPSYVCNFKCAYCYQDGYVYPPVHNQEETARVFFAFVQDHFAGRKKYITLFGGEPLLDNPAQAEFLSFFTESCKKADLDLAVVTNGYHLLKYIPVLKKAVIREIQVTLDGTESIHNIRRPLKNGKTTFAEIVAGIDAALEHEIPVNLRIVLDKENIGFLPEFAHFAIQRGWTGSPLFKTQLGRNYELHHCQSKQSQLYSRIDLYRDLYGMIQQHPQIMHLHKPAYSVSRFLFDQGALPDPLFDSCPGCKTEWAFDYTGSIYSCTATVGKAGEELGTFYPEVTWKNVRINEWQQRDILSIPKCSTCNIRLACGGGCASVAYNHEGHLLAPDCRPIQELLEMGISLYQNIHTT